jgi:ribosomal protein S18 acetylase RimI-like enzyme
MLDIRPATTAADFQAVRTLVLSFIGWLRVLFADDPALIDEYFIAVQPELDSLPGPYGPPGGRLLLATLDGRAVGTVALRDLGDGTCEMKRMYVDTTVHGQGVGRALAEALVAQARLLGYARMRLDTSRRQAAAIRLYRRLGFDEIAPYYDASALVRESMHFMELSLRPAADGAT